MDDGNNENDDDEEENDDENIGGVCFRSMRAILSADLSQNFYSKSNELIFQLVAFSLSEKTCDFLEEGLNILNLYLFKSDTID